MRPAYSLAVGFVPPTGSARGGVGPTGVAAHPLPTSLGLTLCGPTRFHVGEIDPRHAHGAENGRHRLHHRHPVQRFVNLVHAVEIAR